jgi:hypothetical protein
MSTEPELKYLPVEDMAREDIAKTLAEGTPEERGEAIWSATYHHSDWRGVQGLCLERLADQYLPVRWTAANCLGLLAAYHKKLDLHLVLPALHKAHNDPSISSAVDDSLMEIRHHLKLQ